MNSKAVLAKIRELCASIPDFHEGSHAGAIALKAGSRMFGTFREKGDDSELVVGLDPEHAAALLERDPRFAPYPRAAHTVRIRTADIQSWAEIRPLVLESYELYGKAKPRAKRAKPARPGGKGRAGARSRAK